MMAANGNRRASFAVECLSLPITLPTAENLGSSPDGRNRHLPVRKPLTTAGCDQKLRRMEFLVGTIRRTPIVFFVIANARHRRVRFWLGTDSPVMSPVRPLFPQKQTFVERCPLCPRFLALHPRERTHPRVSMFSEGTGPSTMEN